MKGQPTAELNLPLLSARRFLATIWERLVLLRLALYRTGYLKQARSPLFTVSIGNITVGGTGKTPFVEYTARLLLEEGYQPSIISRGYGRRKSKPVVLVSDGKSLLADIDVAGDEPVMLAHHLPGVLIAVASNRAAAARWIESRFRPHVHILDDGFQHLSFSRDLDLLLIDALDPFGDEEMLPLGRLREPLVGIARATAIVVTRADHPFDQLLVESRLRSVAGEIPIFYSFHEAVDVVNPRSQERFPPQKLYNQPVAALCAIGNPQAFLADLRRYGANVVYFRPFRDHHRFTQREIDHVFQLAADAHARLLLTTEKDWLRLCHQRIPQQPPLYIVKIQARVADEGDFRRFLLSRIRNHKRATIHT